MLTAGIFITVAVFCAVLPPDCPEIALALGGAVVYAQFHKGGRSKPSQGDKDRRSVQKGAPSCTPAAAAAPRSAPEAPGASRRHRKGFQLPMPDFDAMTSSPAWESQVEEFVAQNMPSSECSRTLEGVANLVRETLCQTIPEAKIQIFSSGAPAPANSFGASVPQVDLVVRVGQARLLEILEQRLSRSDLGALQFDHLKLQKSSIRAIADSLITQGGFKFRRCKFSGEEPKISLLVPSLPSLNSEAFTLDLTVNSDTPLRTQALLNYSGGPGKPTQALAQLVKRWARFRGIANDSKGHLSPYAWTVLVVYFMEGSATVDRTVATLFIAFVRFYHSFDWQNCPVSLSHAFGNPPRLAKSRTRTPSMQAQARVWARVEDPFDAEVDLGSRLTTEAAARLLEELVRAELICNRLDASLVDLLEPWMPPDAQAKPGTCSQRPAPESVSGARS